MPPAEFTAVATAPTSDLKEAFPPAINQHGESVWPTVLMLVAHELHRVQNSKRGCALVPEIGAMYGDDNTSEAALLKTLSRRLPDDAIVLADAGFGIFGPVWDCLQSGRSVAFRLSTQKFKSLVQQATPRRKPVLASRIR